MSKYIDLMGFIMGDINIKKNNINIVLECAMMRDECNNMMENITNVIVQIIKCDDIIDNMNNCINNISDVVVEVNECINYTLEPSTLLIECKNIIDIISDVLVERVNCDDIINNMNERIKNMNECINNMIRIEKKSGYIFNCKVFDKKVLDRNNRSNELKNDINERIKKISNAIVEVEKKSNVVMDIKKCKPTPTSLLIKNKFIANEPKFIEYKRYDDSVDIEEIDVEYMKNKRFIEDDIKLIFMFDGYIKEIISRKQDKILSNNMEYNNIDFIFDKNGIEVGFMTTVENKHVNYFYLDKLYKQFMKTSNLIEIMEDGIKKVINISDISDDQIKLKHIADYRLYIQYLTEAYEAHEGDDDFVPYEYNDYDYISYRNNFNLINQYLKN